MQSDYFVVIIYRYELQISNGIALVKISRIYRYNGLSDTTITFRLYYFLKKPCLLAQLEVTYFMEKSLSEFDGLYYAGDQTKLY